jgi:hypothetical protein
MRLAALARGLALSALGTAGAGLAHPVVLEARQEGAVTQLRVVAISARADDLDYRLTVKGMSQVEQHGRVPSGAARLTLCEIRIPTASDWTARLRVSGRDVAYELARTSDPASR